MSDRKEIGPCVLYHANCFDLKVEAEHVITDPPFSQKTHLGHDSIASGNNCEGCDSAERRDLGYAFWTEGDVVKFCESFKMAGWQVVFTDHILARAYEREMSARDRYVFAPLPSFTPGRSVRISGDGPSSWTDWIVVSRTAALVKWGTLSGGFVNPSKNRNGAQMGGKPVGLMCRLVQEYSRRGETVCDPCMGSGSTGIACVREGRKFIGIEQNKERFEIACERIERELKQCVLL